MQRTVRNALVVIVVLLALAMPALAQTDGTLVVVDGVVPGVSVVEYSLPLWGEYDGDDAWSAFEDDWLVIESPSYDLWYVAPGEAIPVD